MKQSGVRGQAQQVGSLIGCAGTATSFASGVWVFGWSTATPAQRAMVLVVFGAAFAVIGTLIAVACRITSMTITPKLAVNLLEEHLAVERQPPQLYLCETPTVESRQQHHAGG